MRHSLSFGTHASDLPKRPSNLHERWAVKTKKCIAIIFGTVRCNMTCTQGPNPSISSITPQLSAVSKLNPNRTTHVHVRMPTNRSRSMQRSQAAPRSRSRPPTAIRLPAFGDPSWPSTSSAYPTMSSNLAHRTSCAAAVPGIRKSTNTTIARAAAVIMAAGENTVRTWRRGARAGVNVDGQGACHAPVHRRRHRRGARLPIHWHSVDRVGHCNEMHQRGLPLRRLRLQMGRA